MSLLTTPRVEVALLTGGGDTHYAFGMATALMARDVSLDLIAGDDLEQYPFGERSRVTFFNLRGTQRTDASPLNKAARVLIYYCRLLGYAWHCRPKVFHILWNNKFETIDRTLLMLYYKALGKKVVLTAHNVNAGRRDANDTILNRLTLTAQYRLADHIFVHTSRMKSELVAEFGVRESSVSVIPYGINNAVAETAISRAEARHRLGIGPNEKALLFYGSIAPYKGLEYLVAAFERLVAESDDYHLIIAGRPKKGSEGYWDALSRTINGIDKRRIVQHIEFIPDDDTELYFKAADVLILPYTEIFQSGVLFLGYRFGLPAIVADVGSLRDDVVEGQTGFVFKAEDAVDLARAIETYFASELFKALPEQRQRISEHVTERHSWDTVGQMTKTVYKALLERAIPASASPQIRRR